MGISFSEVSLTLSLLQRLQQALPTGVFCRQYPLAFYLIEFWFNDSFSTGIIKVFIGQISQQKRPKKIDRTKHSI